MSKFMSYMGSFFGSGEEFPKNSSFIPTIKERKDILEKLLEQECIDIKKMRSLCRMGIPEFPGLRRKCWLMLLGVLSSRRSQWNEEIRNHDNTWKGFIEEFFAGSPIETSSNTDHPLSLEKDSEWNKYFKDYELLKEINKDVKRTYPTLNFFAQSNEVHLNALRRILFVWCKLNPGVGYVQGMNEVIGPIYYSFFSESERDSPTEALVFVAFTNIMSEIMNYFIKHLDRSECGIVKQIHLLEELLIEKDYQLAENLQEKGLNLQFFTFRQLTLLMSQEFELPDVLRLWDTLFSETDKIAFLRFFCCAMVIMVRETLLTTDCAENIKLMQSYPLKSIEELIRLAYRLRDDKNYVAPKINSQLLVTT